MAAIDTPQGRIIHVRNANGSITARLEWNPNFSGTWNGQYSKAQAFVDNEVLRLSAPYTPLRTSMLIKSGILGTAIGKGEVKWVAPYAKAQYYSVRSMGSARGSLRGSYWFERMKNDHKQGIMAGARRIAGGK